MTDLTMDVCWISWVTTCMFDVCNCSTMISVGLPRETTLLKDLTWISAGLSWRTTHHCEADLTMDVNTLLLADLSWKCNSHYCETIGTQFYQWILSNWSWQALPQLPHPQGCWNCSAESYSQVKKKVIVKIRRQPLTIYLFHVALI